MRSCGWRITIGLAWGMGSGLASVPEIAFIFSGIDVDQWKLATGGEKFSRQSGQARCSQTAKDFRGYRQVYFVDDVGLGQSLHEGRSSLADQRSYLVMFI